MKKGTGKIVVLAASFAVFMAGVWALYSEPGMLRTTVLWGSLIVLVAIALRQTLKNVKK